MRCRTFTGESTGSRKRYVVICYMWILGQIPMFLFWPANNYWVAIAVFYMPTTLLVAIYFALRNMVCTFYEYRFNGNAFVMTGKESYLDLQSNLPDERSLIRHVVCFDTEIVSVRATTPNNLVWACFRRSRKIRLHYRLSGGGAYAHDVCLQSITTDSDCQDSSVAAALLSKLEECLGRERIEDLVSWQQAKNKARRKQGPEVALTGKSG